ncbi:hypothetical protein E1H99_04760 [Enterococcus hirae]|nr:hypothetical protein E1H99_04760 [Enterococcus hirae]
MLISFFHNLDKRCSRSCTLGISQKNQKYEELFSMVLSDVSVQKLLSQLFDKSYSKKKLQS